MSTKKLQPIIPDTIIRFIFGIILFTALISGGTYYLQSSLILLKSFGLFAHWLTILILGHILVPVLVTIDYYFMPELWIILLVAVSLGAASSILLLPNAKGLCLGLIWGLRFKECEPHSGGEDA